MPDGGGGKRGDETLSLSSSGSQAGGSHGAFVMVSAGEEFEEPSKERQPAPSGGMRGRLLRGAEVTTESREIRVAGERAGW